MHLSEKNLRLRNTIYKFKIKESEFKKWKKFQDLKFQGSLLCKYIPQLGGVLIFNIGKYNASTPFQLQIGDGYTSVPKLQDDVLYLDSIYYHGVPLEFLDEKTYEFGLNLGKIFPREVTSPALPKEYLITPEFIKNIGDTIVGGWECNDDSLSVFTTSRFGKSPEEVFPNRDTTCPLGFSIITDVVEEDSGERWGILKDFAVRWASVTYRLIHAKPDEALWEIVDANRVLYFGKDYSAPWGGLSDCKVIFLEPLKTAHLPSTEALQRFLTNHVGNFPIRLTQKMSLYITESNLSAISQAEEETKSQSIKETKILSKLSDHAGSVELAEMTIYPKEVVYEGQTLACTAVTPKQGIESIISTFGLSGLNFDRYFSYFINTICDKVGGRIFENKYVGTMGNIPFKIEMVKRTNSAEITSQHLLINNVRINKIDAKAVLRRALCFTHLSTYNQYLSTISKCSIRIHEALRNGIVTKVRDSLLQQDSHIKLDIVRRGYRHFLVIGKKEIQIHNVNKIIDITQCHSIDSVLEILSNPGVISLNEQDIGKVIRAGRVNYVAALKRSQALLKKTCKLINVSKTERTVGGQSRQGYVIEGKLHTYFLEHTPQAQVYDLGNNDRTICIIEKSGGTDSAGVDKLVHRMLALKNDSKVAQYIHTI